MEVFYLWLSALALFNTYCTGQMSAVELDFCNTDFQHINYPVDFSAGSETTWPADRACYCTLTPNTSTIVSVSADLRAPSRPEEEEEEDDDYCPPMIEVSSELSATRDVNYLICGQMDADKSSRYRHQIMLSPDRPLRLHLYNPTSADIQTTVSIQDFAGYLAVQCTPRERIQYETCPCSVPYVTTDTGATTFDERRRLMIGLVTAFMFALIIVLVIVGIVFYKRRQKKAKNTDEVVTAENRAYQGSKQSVNTDNKIPEKNAPVSFSPDPNINLQLQTGHHGSKDSGVASGNENTNGRGRLPFMQPGGASTSLDNLTAMPENYPSLAGHGSKASLNTSSVNLEPTYTTRPGPPPNLNQSADPTYTNRAGPPPFFNQSAGSQSNYPPLAGQGSRSSLDRDLDPPPRKEDVVYAKLHKRPQLSASDDRLNRHQEGDMGSKNALNASTMSVETDV